ncbi:carbohydrate ABC transporter permease [Ruania zhangjianzhongii]|uniref:carbohydrate ABC transporter permease n=1 Tax=Ruania zhangjianzhongii TaxID=2603206 RepID=UPI001AEFCDA0|nr:carbohydrate ABC transporter permease [Ruania zhangjianzhongii]
MNAPIIQAPSGTRRSSQVSGRHIATSVLHYGLLIVVALVFLVPLYWLFTSAFKDNTEIYQWPPVWLPSSLDPGNFVRAWQAAPFGQFLLNSALMTTVGTVAKTVLACTTAYAFVYLRFPAKNVLFVVLLSAIMIPGNVSIIVNYLTVSGLGWVNTYLGLIVPGIGSVFGTFLLRQHMLTLPRELLEAAQVDGASHLRRLVQIVLPISRPIVVTVAILAVIDEWNSFIWPLIVTNTDSMRTLPIGLYFLKAEEGGVADWGLIMAGTVFVLLPMLVIFLLAQRFIVSGLVSGAVKG